MEDVGILIGHSAYFTAIWFILWPFGTFYCHLVYFVAIFGILWLFGAYFSFGILYRVKSGNHARHLLPAIVDNTFKLASQ
jgi:hypothetical protein